MDSETIKLLEAYSKAKKEDSLAQGNLVQDLYDKGYKPFHFVDMRETEDKQGAKFRDSVLRHIVKGWQDPSAEKLYYANPKSLSQTDLALQAFHQNTARVAYNNMKQALKNRIEKGDNKPKSKQAANLIMALRGIKNAIERLEKEDKSPYAGIADDLKALKALKILSSVKDSK